MHPVTPGVSTGIRLHLHSTSTVNLVMANPALSIDSELLQQLIIIVVIVIVIVVIGKDGKLIADPRLEEDVVGIRITSGTV